MIINISELIRDSSIEGVNSIRARFRYININYDCYFENSTDISTTWAIVNGVLISGEYWFSLDKNNDLIINLTNFNNFKEIVLGFK